jgi:hypothetical protein
VTKAEDDSDSDAFDAAVARQHKTAEDVAFILDEILASALRVAHGELKDSERRRAGVIFGVYQHSLGPTQRKHLETRMAHVKRQAEKLQAADRRAFLAAARYILTSGIAECLTERELLAAFPGPAAAAAPPGAVTPGRGQLHSAVLPPASRSGR